MLTSNNLTGPAFTKRIGSTIYEVSMHFNQEVKETMDEKILRLIKNDLNLAPGHVTMAAPQMDRLPERSSYEHKQAAGE